MLNWDEEKVIPINTSIISEMTVPELPRLPQHTKRERKYGWRKFYSFVNNSHHRFS